MKKLLFVLALLVGFVAADAQTRTVLSPRNLTNVDTLTLSFPSVTGTVLSFQTTVVKVSGTVAGTVYIKATNDGKGWLTLDSLVLSNVTTAQTKFTAPATQYSTYQAYFLTSGTQVYTPYFTLLKK